MRKHHANHGRDHLPIGADPIPLFTDRSCLGCYDVPIEFAECAKGALDPFAVVKDEGGDICGAGDTAWISAQPVGRPLLGAVLLQEDGITPALKLQIRLSVSFPAPFCETVDVGSGPEELCYSNIENVIVFGGVEGGLSQIYVKGWPVAGEPGAAGPNFNSGWVDAVGLPGGSGCDELWIAANFLSHSSFSGGCVTGGSVEGRWVPLGDGGEYRGALDDLPPGVQQNDVIHFDSRTNEFVIGPGSVPSRAISTFFG
jgi:hypothetical protein